MKASELRNMSLDELKGKLLDLKKELFNLRFRKVGGSVTDTSAFSKLKKDIARVMTILREKHYSGEVNA